MELGTSLGNADEVLGDADGELLGEADEELLGLALEPALGVAVGYEVSPPVINFLYGKLRVVCLVRRM